VARATMLAQGPCFGHSEHRYKESPTLYTAISYICGRNSLVNFLSPRLAHHAMDHHSRNTACEEYSQCQLIQPPSHVTFNPSLMPRPSACACKRIWLCKSNFFWLGLEFESNQWNCKVVFIIESVDSNVGIAQTRNILQYKKISQNLKNG